MNTNNSNGDSFVNLRLENGNKATLAGGSGAVVCLDDTINLYTASTVPTITNGPTWPDNTNNIATTRFVTSAINTVSGGITQYTYTTHGTYFRNVPTNSTRLKIVCIGAGGGGGGGTVLQSSVSGATGGGGGGGGGITIVEVNLSTETSFVVNVGLGGSGGSPGNTNSNGNTGNSGTNSYVYDGATNIYYGYAFGGSGGGGAINNLPFGSTSQPLGGTGGIGTQGNGGNGGLGVGVGSPTNDATLTSSNGFIFTGTVGGTSNLIGAGGGGGGGATYLTGGPNGVYFDTYGGNGGGLGYSLSGNSPSYSIITGYGVGGVQYTAPTIPTGILGVGGGGGGGGYSSRFSGSGIPASSGSYGIYGGGGGGGGSDHTYGATGGNGGDGVVILLFS